MMPELYTSLTEDHSVALPGLGTMRFGLRAKNVTALGATSCMGA